MEKDLTNEYADKLIDKGQNKSVLSDGMICINNDAGTPKVCISKFDIEPQLQKKKSDFESQVRKDNTYWKKIDVMSNVKDFKTVWKNLKAVEQRLIEDKTPFAITQRNKADGIFYHLVFKTNDGFKQVGTIETKDQDFKFENLFLNSDRYMKYQEEVKERHYQGLNQVLNKTIEDKVDNKPVITKKHKI